MEIYKFTTTSQLILHCLLIRLIVATPAEVLLNGVSTCEPVTPICLDGLTPDPSTGHSLLAVKQYLPFVFFL